MSRRGDHGHLLLLAALALAGCRETPTSVLLKIRNGGGVPAPASLTVTAWDRFGLVEPPTRLPETGSLPAPEGDLLGTYVIFASANSRELRVSVRGRTSDDVVVSENAVRSTVVAGRQLTADVVLRAGRLPDTDRDSVPDAVDNCPGTANSDQVSTLGELAGDACAATDAAVDQAPDVGETDAPHGAGHALRFDGVDDAIPVPRMVSSDFTMEMWIGTTVGGTTTSLWTGPVLASGDVPNAARDFSVGITQGKVWLLVGGPAGDTVVTGSTNVATGNWVHLAVTRHRSTGALHIYVNGVLDDAAPVTGHTGSLSDTTVVHVGGDPAGRGHFEGLMDELRFWTVTRTAAEIARDAHRRLTGTEGGLAAYYRFDEGTGSVAVDSGPEGLDVTLGGTNATRAPAWTASTAPIE